jgi:hypothetical protein
VAGRLQSLIQNTIAPHTWQGVGGNGRIDYYPLGRALVISQTPDVHEMIEAFLTGLRELQKAGQPREAEPKATGQ